MPRVFMRGGLARGSFSLCNTVVVSAKSDIARLAKLDAEIFSSDSSRSAARITHRPSCIMLYVEYCDYNVEEACWIVSSFRNQRAHQDRRRP
ncbi:hypothetical protein BOTBODRAFT_32884 [Botryobasidium botryosum FD-172 SS1]|uniref:Uncharacterized protein n=1 Tax=Botryobasidium botryosum (strain FD-172 SS1) TaxID=930990 RepID=A0A067MQC4_BOTB1|nr:hypothetical protein BOTBODRAFT_32884 [Botryobasidium botryosum FD-172 SS1]